MGNSIESVARGVSKIRDRIQRYIELLLTSNPAAYLDPQFKGQIDLRRLTRIYQWLDPSLDESAVFELQRENLFSWWKDKGATSDYKWVKSLPAAIVSSREVKGSFFGNLDETKCEAMKRLPEKFNLMESLIETSNRLEGYKTEVQSITRLGLSFLEWQTLAPSDEIPSEGVNLMYIIPAKPLSTIDEGL